MKIFVVDKFLPGQTRDNHAINRVQGPNRFWQEFPVLQFCRQKLWPFLLQQVDDGDEKEESSNGDEDNVDDDRSGQREKKYEAREDEEHANKVNKCKPPVFCRGITQRLDICMSQ